MMNNADNIFRVIETNNASKVAFKSGQFIIQDDGQVFYDPTYGVSNETGSDISDRQQLIVKNPNVYNFNSTTVNDEDYLSLIEEVNKNDICIISKLINGTTNKYEHTSYVCSEITEEGEPVWNKLTDNYNADNVYVSKNIIATIDLDGYELENGKIELDTQGKDITSVLQSILGPEKLPKTTLPSVTISTNLSSKYEVGSTVNPEFTGTWNPGSYEFGPDTGAEIESIIVKDSNGSVNSHVNVVGNQFTGSLNAFKMDEMMNYNMWVEVLYSNGVVPNKVPSGTYPDGKIVKNSTALKATSATSHSYLEGCYCGTLTTKIDPNAIDSDVVRSLTPMFKENYSKKTLNFTVAPGTKTIMIAYPKSKNGPTKILNTTVNADMTNAFTTVESVNVKDAENSNEYSSEYSVLYYCPAEAYTTSANISVVLG